MYKSSENPPDNPINTTPVASLADNNTATAESPGIFVDSLNLVIPREARIETANAVHIGYTFVNKPILFLQMPHVREHHHTMIASSRLERDQSQSSMTATAIPEINARCIKPN